MKIKKDFYLVLLIFICSFILIGAGALMINLSQNDNVITVGIISICIAPFIMIWGIVRAVSLRSVNKEERKNAKKQLAKKCEEEKLINAADYGLCDIVEGMVELKKDTPEQEQDIQSILKRIKRKRFNTILISREEAQAIKKANPFLPESYITFLSEVGFVDFDWIDVGWNARTLTNLDDEDAEAVKNVFAEYEGMNYVLDDFYFIGIDNDGRHYAFSRNRDDEKVYVFADDMLDIPPYDTFEEFLTEILNV